MLKVAEDNQMSSSFPIYQDGTMNSSDEAGSLDFHGRSFSSFIMNNNGNDNQIQLLDRPMKQPRTSCLPSDPFDNNNSQIISFGLTTGGLLAKPKHEAADSSDVVVVTPDNNILQSCYNNNNNPSAVSNGGIIISSRTPYKAQDHVLAERKRREKLSQRLIALSAVIPTLKKMDKATVLEDAVTYIKHLEQRIKTLEREAATKSMESVITVKKTTSQVVLSADHDDASSSYHHHDTCNFDQRLLEIEARVSEKYVLIRVHCEKRKDCITTILNLIEKMNLTVLSNSIMQFGTSILDITIVAQIEAEFDTTIQELVKKIRQHLHSI